MIANILMFIISFTILLTKYLQLDCYCCIHNTIFALAIITEFNIYQTFAAMHKCAIFI